MADDENLPSDARQNPPIGWLNNDRPPSSGTSLDHNTLHSEYMLQQTMVGFMAQQETCELEFPRRAICVVASEYVSEAGASYDSTVNIGRTLGSNPYMVLVKAYDDFLDGGSFPAPDFSAIVTGRFNEREAILRSMCPTYYGVGPMEVPSPGDIVWIDYADRQNLSGGIYKGIAEKVSVVPSPYAESAMDSMQDAIGVPLMQMDVGADVGSGTKADIDDLCDGPVSTRGSAFGGGSVETVIIDGVPVAKDMAGYWITMRDAAAAATPSVTLSLTSGFRANEDLAVDTNCPLDGSPDATFSGQQSLWEGYQDRVGWAEASAASDSEEDIELAMGGANPYQKFNLAATPGTSQHQNGRAFDIDLGYSTNDTKQPHPEAMTETYKWLLLNAHKYGFVRTVANERWHWEYLGGGSQFKQDPKGALTRDHNSWDNFFVEGEEGTEMLEESREGSITTAEEAWEDTTNVFPEERTW